MKIHRVAIALIFLATFANTVMHILVPDAKVSWIVTEIEILLILMGGGIAIALSWWALGEFDEK